MPNEQPNILARAASSTADFFIRWWREATGPIRRSQHRTYFRAILRRVMLWVPVLVLALIVFGAVGFYLLSGWRARDLTAKALDNAEAGQARFARLQIASAMNLRPSDPAVKRAAALIESRLGNPNAVAMWEEMAGGEALSADEIDARAEVMALHGNDEQFAAAIAALEAQGGTVRAAELRSQRSVRGGNLEQAVAEARAAATAKDEPRLRLQLLQLLAARYGPLMPGPRRGGPQDLAAANEMAGLIDGLIDSPAADDALALGLGAAYFPDDKKSAWAAAAWRNAQASNPALLPAAEFLAVSGAETPEALRNKLNLIFIGAPLPQQAEFARWMLRRGMTDQVLITASAAEAAQDEGIFGVRAAALANLGRWDELYKLAAAPSQAPNAMRLLAQARAARELGRRSEEAELARTALRGALREGRLVPAIRVADAQDLQPVADEVLIELCGDSAAADNVFRLARDRFGRGGQFAKLDQAFVAARQAAPSATSVLAYERYSQLLNGGGIDPSVTAEALAANPKDVDARFNHALALLKAGRGKEAAAVFDDFDVVAGYLRPGLRAVSAALLDAQGNPSAFVVARRINPDLLTPGEYALIAPLRNAGR
ncbi:MAG: hypothetical protein FGM15_10880 [Chthoniobacterales bacterium]|nr:hypothetical protein [Chthoniobacterales bacterium]